MANKVVGPQTLSDGFRDHAQNRGFRFAAIRRAEMFQLIYLQSHDAEREVIGGVAGKGFTQMKLREALIGNAGGFIQASIYGKVVLMAVAAGGKLPFIKTLRQP